jgi:TatD DNase family protein
MPFLKKTKVPFIFHGFTGNIQQAKEILKFNAYLSFGKSLLDEKHQEVFSQIPNDRFLLETDVAKIGISQIYDLATMAKGIAVDELKSVVFNTFAAITKSEV